MTSKENVMYVITNEGGSYDDKWSNIMFYTNDIIKANDYVNRMNAFVRTVTEAKELRVKFCNDYEVTNPRPKAKYGSTESKELNSKWYCEYKIAQDKYDSLIDMDTLRGVKESEDATYWYVEEVPELK